MFLIIEIWKKNLFITVAYLAQLIFGDYMKRRLGYEIVGEGDGPVWKNHKIFQRNLPFLSYRISQDPYVIPFQVEINSIVSRVGFSYDISGWHPFVETLKEYINNPKIRYKDTSLAKLYHQYQPSSLQEILLDDFDFPITPLSSLPATNEMLRNIWTFNKFSLLKNTKIASTKEGWIFYGPHSMEYGEKEFSRLIDVYESIRKNGYRMDMANKEPINGYFLKKENKTKFVLLQGNHRLSALHVLGYEEVNAVIRKGHPAIIAWDKLINWTNPEGGIYSLPVAQLIFNSLFEGTGLEKAKRHQLI